MIEAYFTALGFIGGLLYVLIWAKSWSDLKTFESIRHLIVGAIAGYIYCLLHSKYSFPDTIMAIVSGYFGVDFLSALFEKFKQKVST